MIAFLRWAGSIVAGTLNGLLKFAEYASTTYCVTDSIKFWKCHIAGNADKF